MIKILYFGQLQDVTQLSEEELDASNIDELKNILFESYPTLKEMSFAISLNREIIQEATLKPNDEVALLPPFSGG